MDELEAADKAGTSHGVIGTRGTALQPNYYFSWFSPLEEGPSLHSVYRMSKILKVPLGAQNQAIVSLPQMVIRLGFPREAEPLGDR